MCHMLPVKPEEVLIKSIEEIGMVVFPLVATERLEDLRDVTECDECLQQLKQVITNSQMDGRMGKKKFHQKSDITFASEGS